VMVMIAPNSAVDTTSNDAAICTVEAPLVLLSLLVPPVEEAVAAVPLPLRALVTPLPVPVAAAPVAVAAAAEVVAAKKRSVEANVWQLLEEMGLGV